MSGGRHFENNQLSLERKLGIFHGLFDQFLVTDISLPFKTAVSKNKQRGMQINNYYISHNKLILVTTHHM